MAKPGKHARVMIMSTTSTPFTDEATTPDATFTIYTIDDRTMRYWDRDTPVVVERNGTPVPANEYRVQYAGGRIHFYEPQEEEDEITVSGAFVSVVVAAECREFTMSIGREMVDVTVFESDGWRDRLSGIGGVTGTISGFYNINNLFTERLLQQKPLVLEFWTSKDDPEFFAVYAVLESQELSAAVEGAVETSVGWQSDGELLIEQEVTP